MFCNMLAMKDKKMSIEILKKRKIVKIPTLLTKSQ